MKQRLIMLESRYIYSMYGSPNIVGVIKFRRLRCAGLVARMEEGKPTGKRPLGSPRLRWETILKSLLNKKNVSIRGIEFIRSRIGIIGKSL